MDIALAVHYYLQDKQELIDSDANWNPALVELQDISGWRFANIPMPTLEELQEILDSH